MTPLHTYAPDFEPYRPHRVQLKSKTVWLYDSDHAKLKRLAEAMECTMPAALSAALAYLEDC